MTDFDLLLDRLRWAYAMGLGGEGIHYGTTPVTKRMQAAWRLGYYFRHSPNR